MVKFTTQMEKTLNFQQEDKMDLLNQAKELSAQEFRQPLLVLFSNWNKRDTRSNQQTKIIYMYIHNSYDKNIHDVFVFFNKNWVNRAGK